MDIDAFIQCVENNPDRSNDTVRAYRSDLVLFDRFLKSNKLRVLKSLMLLSTTTFSTSIGSPICDSERLVSVAPLFAGASFLYVGTSSS